MTTLLDRIRAHYRGLIEERMAPTPVEGVPLCDRDHCPLYDGKRCEAQGGRPESLCGPAVEAMGALLDDDDAPPPADPVLLASANRALAERLEHAERERDALRDAALALVALDEDSPEADAAWAALCRLLTPVDNPTTTR